MFKFAGPPLRATAFAFTLGMSALSAAPAFAAPAFADPVEVISVSAPAVVLVAAPLTPAAAPTMSEWATILLGAGLAVGGTLYLRRRLLLPR